MSRVWFDRVMLAVGFVLAIAVPLRFVVQAEDHLATADSILLELAPVDPRSLMQGDYMRLAYALEQRVQADDPSYQGTLVVHVDEHGVATNGRLDDGSPLAADERRLAYFLRNGRLRVGPDGFFFQEGHAKLYAHARYGELKVSEGGAAILVGLRGEDFEVLGPESAQ